MTELEDLAQQVRLLRAGTEDGAEPEDAYDPTAIHVGDLAGGDLTGTYPNPTLATPAAALPTDRPVIFDPVIRSTDSLALSSYNGGGFAQDYTFTDVDGTDYILWYNSSLSPWMGKKGPNDLDWEVFDLSSVNSIGTPTGTANTSGNPLQGPVNTDGHNFSTFGMDSAGRIHVAGNMHSTYSGGLHYMKSTNARDVSAWSGRLNMTASNEANVTYPMFHRMPNDDLIFFYRNGSSGDGNSYLKVWNGTDWDDLGLVIDGDTDGVSAYLLPPVVHADGTLSIIFNWRTTGAATTNVGWYYFRLSGIAVGGTLVAKKTDGTAITLPIRIATGGQTPEQIASFPAPYLLNDAAPGAFQPEDADGYPHSSFMSIDPVGNPQHYHIFQDSTGWHVDQFTNFGAWTPAADWTGSAPAGDASRWKILNTPDGKTLALGHWPGEGLRGALWCMDITPGQTGYVANASVASPPSRAQPSGSWLKSNRMFRLHEFPDQGDFHYNFQAVADNKLKILITASSQRFYHDPGINSTTGNTSASSETDIPTGWGSPTLEEPRGVLGLLTIDLSQLDLFKNGQVRLPTIRVATESTGSVIPVQKGISAFTAAGTLLQFTRSRHSFTASTAQDFIAFDVNNVAAGATTGNTGQGNAPVIVIPSTVSGGILFARMFVMMEPESGGGFVSACMCESVSQSLSPSHAQTAAASNEEYNIGACWNDTTIGSNVTQSSYNAETVMTTSWIRLRHFGTQGSGHLGRLYLRARTGGAAETKGTVHACVIQLGVLDVP